MTTRGEGHTVQLWWKARDCLQLQTLKYFMERLVRLLISEDNVEELCLRGLFFSKNLCKTDDVFFLISCWFLVGLLTLPLLSSTTQYNYSSPAWVAGCEEQEEYYDLLLECKWLQEMRRRDWRQELSDSVDSGRMKEITSKTWWKVAVQVVWRYCLEATRLFAKYQAKYQRRKRKDSQKAVEERTSSSILSLIFRCLQNTIKVRKVSTSEKASQENE